MPASIEAVTTAALSAAMEASIRRHTAVAANIANVHAEDYVPLRVSFDARLEEARGALRDGGLLEAGWVDALRGRLQADPDAAQPVQVDMQMSEMARNTVHFQALTQAVSRHLAMLALAAADGRK